MPKNSISPDYEFNGLNYQNWQAEGRAWFVKHGKMDGWPNRFWTRPDGEQIELYSTKRGPGPKRTPDEVVARGGHMKPRKTSVRTAFVGNRRSREQVPESLSSRFESPEAFEEYKTYVKRGNNKNQALASRASENGPKFNKGHIAAVGAGGSHDPMAQRLEAETGNKSSQNVAEIPKDRLKATGTPSSWDEAVTMYQNPELVPTQLTPLDKQRIWSGTDPAIVYGQRQKMIFNNPLARPNSNRNSLLQPTIRGLGIRSNYPNGFLNAGLLDKAGGAIKNNWKSELFGTAIGLATDPAQRQNIMDGNVRGLIKNGTRDAIIGGVTNNLVKLGISKLPVALAGPAASVVNLATPVIAGLALGEGLKANKRWRDENKRKEKNLTLYGSNNPTPHQIGQGKTGKAILNGEEITVPYGSVAGEGQNFAQKGLNALKSSAQNNINAALSAFGF